VKDEPALASRAGHRQGGRARLATAWSPGEGRGRELLPASHPEFLTFLEPGDEIDDEALEDAVHRLDASVETAFAALGTSTQWTRTGTASTASAPDLVRVFLEGAPGGPAPAIYRRRAVDELGGPDPAWGELAEYDLRVRLALRHPVEFLHRPPVRRAGEGGRPGRERILLAQALRILTSRLREAPPGLPRGALRMAIRIARLQLADRWLNAGVEALAVREWPRALRAAAALLRLRSDAPLFLLRCGERSNALDFRVQVEPHAHVDPAAEPSESAGRERPKRLRLVRLHPARTAPGMPFNIQPDGAAALAVECRNARRGTVIVFGEVTLETSFHSQELLTAFVPAELYRTAGRSAVRLRTPR
jgi:hypothetical protein